MQHQSTLLTRIETQPFLTATGSRQTGPLASCGTSMPDQRKLIAVIDDSITIRKIMEACLRREGFQVQSFATGPAFLRWLSTQQERLPDMIFLDIVLPKMDGYQVAQHLNGWPGRERMVLIFLSCRDGILDKVKARLVGAKGYLTKPFQTEEVVRIIRETFGLAPFLTSIYQDNVHLPESEA